MIPLELLLRNFMCYREPREALRLEGLHVACLSGENGAGKSALIDAITWALWGKARLPADELLAQGTTDMAVELRFQLNNQQYRIIRTYTRGKVARSGKQQPGKSTLDFLVWDASADKWQPLGEQGVRETDQRIEQVLRMRYETFINASLLLQGRADEFTSKTPAERKQILADILGLQEYDRLEKRARGRTRELASTLSELDGVIALLADRAAHVATYRAMVNAAAAASEAIQQQVQASEHQLATLEQQQHDLHQQAARRTAAQQQQHELEQEMGRLQTSQTQLSEAIATDTTLLEREGEIAAGVQALHAARERLDALDELQPTYQQLHEQRRELQGELRTAKSELEAARTAAHTAVTNAQEAAAELARVTADITATQTRLAELAPLEAERTELASRHATLAHSITAAARLLHAIERAEATIAHERTTLQTQADTQHNTITRLQQQLVPADRWRVELDDARAQQTIVVDLERQRGVLQQELEHIRQQHADHRARCTHYQQQAEAIKQRRALLTSSDTAECPLCGSHLSGGTASIVQHYDDEIAELRRQYSSSKQTADELESTIQQQHERIRKMEHMVNQSRTIAARAITLEQQMEQVAAWRAELAAAREQHATLSASLADESYAADARQQHADARAALAALAPTAAPDAPPAAIVAALEAAQQTVQQQLDAVQQQLAQHTHLTTQLAVWEHQQGELATRAARLAELTATATQLDEQLANGDYAHDIRAQGRAIDTRLAELGYDADEHRAVREQVRALAHWQDEQHAVAMARQRLSSNRAAQQRNSSDLHRIGETLMGVVAEIKHLTAALAALPTLERDLAAVREQLAAHTAALHSSHTDLGEKRQMLRDAEAAAHDLAQKQTERQHLATQHELYSELVEACGKRGVQAMLIETAIPEIADETNALLSRITDNQMHVYFEMQRSTRRGDTQETLEIQIGDERGTRPYDAFSGGEATRINFAIRIALSRLLAARAGASLETLIIDEGMSALDADGRERFIETLSSIQQDFKRILVITHLEEIKDRFPHRIEITKTANGSMWSIL